MQINRSAADSSHPPEPTRSEVGLVLGLPYFLLVASSVISWPWRVLGLPNFVGELSPMDLVLLGLVILGGVYATRKRLPQRLFTWPAASLAAAAILADKSLATTTEAASAAAEAATEAVAVALDLAILAFVIGVLVIVFSISLSKHGARYGVAFTCLFLMAFAARFPVFALDAEGPVSGAFFLTAFAAVRAALEIGVLLWLAQRLVLAPGTTGLRPVWLMVALLVVHGPLTAWELPLLRGDPLTVLEVLDVTVQWLFFGPLFLVVVAGMCGLRAWMLRDPAAVAAQRASTPKPARPIPTKESLPALPEPDEEAPSPRQDEPTAQSYDRAARSSTRSGRPERRSGPPFRRHRRR